MRVIVWTVTVATSLLWLWAVEPGNVLEPWWVRPDQNLVLLALVALLVGLQLALAQFASESVWRLGDLLVFRGSGPGQAFRAKCAVGAVGTTLFVLVPPLVWGGWQRFEWAASEIGVWGQLLALAQVGTLAWAGWGAGALACQLRRGWGARSLALLLGGAGTFGLAASATSHLAAAPPWMDWLVPVGSALLAVVLAACAGGAFVAGVDEDLPLRDGPGLGLALGGTLALGFPLALVGPSASGVAERALRSSYARVVETEQGELALVDPGDWAAARGWTSGEAPAELRGELVPVIDPWWLGWGWPHPDETIEPVIRNRPFSLGGTWKLLTHPSPRGNHGIESYYEVRSRTVHAFRDDPEGRWHRVHDLSWSGAVVPVQSSAFDEIALLVDPVEGTTTLVRQGFADATVAPIALPGGDALVGLERLVSRKLVEVGYEPPFTYENGLLLRGERGLYELGEEGLVPYAPAPDDRSVASSLADEGRRYATGYALYDGLDPVVEVRDAGSGERLLVARLAPAGVGTAGLKALAVAVTFLHAPVLSLPSFLNDEPWRRGWAFDNAALHGGRRAWLLALQLAFAAWLAWRVRRETRAWGRSRRLGGFWVGATFVLGLPGWLLFRMIEPAAATAFAGARERGDGDRRLPASLPRAEVAR